MANYRTKTRSIGCPEVTVNALKNKSSDECFPAKNVKKAKKAEVNYCPSHPTGKTDESLENLRVELLNDVRQRNRASNLREKMSKTFSYRRKEVVHGSPGAGEFKVRWPALFNIDERITTYPLQTTFMAQLDSLQSQLTSIFQKKGGVTGQKLAKHMQILQEATSDVHSKRAAVLRALCLYLGEDDGQLIHEYMFQGQFQQIEMHKTGDVILGGIFTFHFFPAYPDISFTSEPRQPACYGLDVMGFRLAQTMAYTIDEINRNSNMLPNVTLGYSVYDNCLQTGIGVGAALSLVSGKQKQVTLGKNCSGTHPFLGIVGESSSTRTVAIAMVLGLYRVPMVSYYATCSFLSDRQKFPSFFRTIPSDAFQVRTMIQILKHFGWTWVGLLLSDDEYGIHATRSFHSELRSNSGGCVAYTEILPWGDDTTELRRIVDVMKKSTARVVIVFAYETHLIDLMKEVVRQNVTGLHWMASEAWTSGTSLQTPDFMPYLAGTLGITVRRGEIPGLRDFLIQIRPDIHHNTHGHSVLNQFWEHTFQCRFAPPPAGWVEAGGELCTGQEVIEIVETGFLDVSNLRAEYNVYKAVYALAYALDDMLQCTAHTLLLAQIDKTFSLLKETGI
ncbi:extracellular calcium-sensing receptor-like [Solea senegalensis]|uniref:Extracellular calcium-sensing receptor-like n=1 Tax=Solea senegalensis TaxID=28829 RepID=A0AAV6PR03_SOLSE|nr:extracellular calcium-sensing receptor-like [Solea senegalensis]